MVDDSDFFELQPDYAKNIIIGFGRIDGSPGRHRRQPAAGAGRLSGHQVGDQGCPLRALLRRLQHPVVTFVDVPGFMPGTAQEYGGIIKHGAKLLYAYAECTVPKVTVITRKAYGGAYDVMSSKHLRGDVNLAWPSAEIAVMGPKGAVEIIFREEKNDPPSSPSAKPSIRPSSPTRSWPARGFIDDVIMPTPPASASPVRWPCSRTKQLDNPWRKHGNIPL